MKQFEGTEIPVQETDIFSSEPFEKGKTDMKFFYVNKITHDEKLMVNRVGHNADQDIFEYIGKCYKVQNIMGEYDADA